MKILCLIPPHVPSYFNAGHHLGVFMVAAHLRTLGCVTEVHALDAAALNCTWRDICRRFATGYDVIVMWNDFDGIDTFERCVHYARSLAPEARLVTCGRAGMHRPRLFERLGFDAVARGGDPELAVASYVSCLSSGEIGGVGVSLRGEDGSYRDGDEPAFLPPEEWVLPDVREIPYEAYDRLYGDDLNKFCGIPERRELVVPAARGCPVGCSFCDVPVQQGARERRLSVARVIEYIRWARSLRRFDYVSFYAPTFTLRRGWVEDMCDRLRAESPIRWKCVTTLRHLDEALVARIAAAGCVRVSVGLETMSPRAETALPLLKRNSDSSLVEIAQACRDHGVELNCFIMVGLPGDSPDDARRTITRARELGARVRPVAYTPYEQMHDEIGIEQFGRYNRQLFVDPELPQAERRGYYELLYSDSDDRATDVGIRAWEQRLATRGE